MSRGSGGGNPLWNDLLAYYTADNTPNDALGGSTLTLNNGATYGTGIINQSFSFDGVNDYAETTAPSHDFTTTTTYNLWVYPNDIIGQQFFIYAPVSSKGAGFGMLSNTLTFTRGSVDFRARSTGTVTVNTWNMCTCVFRGNGTNNVDFYINGSYVDTHSMTGILDSNTLNIGGSQYFNGKLDEIGIWSRELTSSEITELYNSGAGLQYT